jgi:putative phosphoesterase
MTLRAGILSDTHIHMPAPLFSEMAEHCFADCEVIIHAGDLTDMAVLDAFAGKKIFAVHGNMCSLATKTHLPTATTFELAGHVIGLTHGAQLGYDIEAGLWDLFPEADCVIYGHTHRPVIHRQGGRLVINPGSFQATGRWGAPGTYAILEADDRLSATLHEVPAST